MPGPELRFVQCGLCARVLIAFGFENRPKKIAERRSFLDFKIAMRRIGDDIIMPGRRRRATDGAGFLFAVRPRARASSRPPDPACSCRAIDAEFKLRA